MAIEKINLRKLIQLIVASPRQRTSLLRDDIRAQIRKDRGDSGNGGDFFVPFWAAAKAHAKGEVKLDFEIAKLIGALEGRRRLYTLMAKSFQEWWSEKRAWRNEPFEIFKRNITCQHIISDLDLTIKIENLIAGKIGEEQHRLVYPYFSETPPLSKKGARLGLYALHKALPAYGAGDFRILDVLRAMSFSVNDVPFNGNEAEELRKEYQAILAERARLSLEYA